MAELAESFDVIAHGLDCSARSRGPCRGHACDERHTNGVLQAIAPVRLPPYARHLSASRKDRPVSTNIEAIRPGLAWNATRVASVLMVVIITVIALAFWPSFERSDRVPPLTQQANGPAAPHGAIVVNGEACVHCLP